MLDNPLIHPHERLDDLHRNGLHLIQDPGLFCFGCDAVLLSHFALVKTGENVLDLGTGTGVIPILLSAKTSANHLTGLDILPQSVALARRNVALNHLEQRITIDIGNIKEVKQLYKPSQFQVVTSNPPYMNDKGGLRNQEDAKAIARHEVLCNLSDVVGAAAYVLGTGGRFYMIHRPHRLVDILCTLRAHQLEPKTLRFVHPFVDKEPTMVLVEAARGGKPMMRVLPPLVMYETPGVYTPEVFQIYYR